MPQIRELVSKLDWSGQLQDGPGTAVEERIIAQEVLAFNLAEYKRESSILYFDMKHSQEKVFGVTKSAFNEMQISFALNLLEKILAYTGKNGFKFALKDITIFAPYKAAEAYYINGLIKFSKVYGPNSSQVRIMTADASQGYQCEVGIIDLTRTAVPGFMAELNRLILLVSRARCGLYIIGNKTAIDQFKRSRAKHLQCFQSAILKYYVPIKDKAVSCAFFDPKAVDMSHTFDDTEAEDHDGAWGEKTEATFAPAGPVELSQGERKLRGMPLQIEGTANTGASTVVAEPVSEQPKDAEMKEIDADKEAQSGEDVVLEQPKDAKMEDVGVQNEATSGGNGRVDESHVVAPQAAT